MRAEHFFVLQQQQNLGRRFGASKMHLSPHGGLGCCPFNGGGSVVVHFLFIVTPIVGVCNCSLFCCTLLYVHSSIAIILMGMRELVALLNLSSWYLAYYFYTSKMHISPQWLRLLSVLRRWFCCC